MNKIFARILMQPDVSPQYLPVVYANLDPGRIPDTGMLEMSFPPSDAILPLSLALRSMEALPFMRLAPPGVYPEIWPRFWIWVQLIEIYCPLLPDYDSVQAIRYRLCACLLGMLHFEAAAHLIHDTPMVYAFFGRTWADLNLDYKIESGTTALYHFIYTSRWTRSNVEEFAEGAGGINNLAALTVRHICFITRSCRSRSPPSPLPKTELRWLTSILTFVRYAGNSGLLKPLLSAGIVGALTGALFPLSETSLAGVELALDACLGDLTATICAPRYPFLAQALDSGLLDAIVLLTARHWSTREIARHLTSFLCFILPSAMTYRPIVATVRGRVPFTEGNQRFRASPFFEHWLLLLELVDQRVQLLNRFESPEYRPTRVCNEVHSTSRILITAHVYMRSVML
jgi:hypothetical protein